MKVEECIPHESLLAQCHANGNDTEDNDADHAFDTDEGFVHTGEKNALVRLHLLGTLKTWSISLQ